MFEGISCHVEFTRLWNKSVHAIGLTVVTSLLLGRPMFNSGLRCVCVGYMFDRVALLQVFSSSTLVFTCIISAVFHIHLVIHLPLTLCHLNSWHCCQITHTNETKICATAGCITGKVTDMYLVAEHCWYNRDSDCWRQLEAVLHCPSCI